MWLFTGPVSQNMSSMLTHRGRLCASRSVRECPGGKVASPLLACALDYGSWCLPSHASTPALRRQLQFSPEEVLGMVLNYSRSLAEDFAGEHQGGAGGSWTSPNV